VLLGDVVGLGKTYMAIDEGLTPLIICPKRLERMWRNAAEDNELRHKIVPLSTMTRDLSELRRYRLVIIDESHNLRNREGRRYQVIRDYIERNESLCLMLTATPYNKHYTDLSNQLRLFLDEKRGLGVRPEMCFWEQDPGDFVADYQAPVDSMVAFEQSEFPEDWDETAWESLSKRLSADLQAKAAPKTIRTKQGHTTEYEEIDAGLSKPIMDEIDRVLAEHYGLTDEELDSIVNYDIKYRMGGAEGEEVC
jgi:hypothetical protein